MILGSDMQLGVHVIDMDVVSFTFPNGKPSSATPGVGATVTVQPVADVDPVDPVSVTLHAAVDGGPDQPVAMAAVGGGQFQAALPAVPCGSRIDWWVTAANGSGETYQSPAGAPLEVNTLHAASSMNVVLADDFSADQGWTVQDQSVSTGTWTRVVPNVSAAQTEFDVPEDAGALCWVTGQGSVGGSVGTQDMDGGPTYLESPDLDFSGGDGRIRYSKWLYNDDVDSDAMTVEVSGNGGASWTLVETFSGQVGGWTRESFVVGDHVVPSANVRVRFGVSDQPNDSITEGAIDDFVAEVVDCGPGAGFVLSVDPLVRGQVSNFTATGGAPGEQAIFLLGLAGQGPGQCFFGGTFCLDVLDPFLVLGSASFDALQQATLPVLVPPGAPLIPTWSQAVVPAGAASLKSNVVPATIQ